MSLRAYYYHRRETQEIVFSWPDSLRPHMPEKLHVGAVPTRPEFGNPEHCRIFDQLNKRLADIHALACSRADSDVELLDSTVDPGSTRDTSQQLDLF